jgi:transcriptional regulator with PAS, ATPase and Fis domain
MPLLTQFLSVQNPLWTLAIVPQDNQEEHDALRSAGVDRVITTRTAENDLQNHIDTLERGTKEEASKRERLQKSGFNQLIGNSPIILQAKEKILVVAETDSPILLAGESGTGKELCARAIHYLGSRSDKPFVPVNCGALPEQLIENELFGHAKGAYTGALDEYRGLVADASGGTLFLDEINSIPLGAQVKILRFLEDSQYRPIGSSKRYEVDVRIVAATNVDLQREIEQGRFREDLYYRINVLSIALPPLRLRQSDIPAIARYYLLESCVRHNKPPLQISDEAMNLLCRYRWPGNVRELRNVIENAVAFSRGGPISPSDLGIATGQKGLFAELLSFKSFKESSEKEFIERALRLNNGNISQTAEATGKDRRSLQRLIKKYGIAVHV